MQTIFIVDIEPLDNRYTKQWSTWIPDLARATTDFKVVVIGGDVGGYDKPSAGAFFDFAGTCAYKSSQANKIAKMFMRSDVKCGDIFLFTDAWNQSVHFLKYMSELNNIDVKIAGIWHAGAYDPTDILGTNIKNVSWVAELERSMFYAYDINFFGTRQHLDKFRINLNLSETDSMCVAGYPFEWISELSNSHTKRDVVVFPHRINDDKAPWFFDMVAKCVHKTHPDIEFIKTQQLNLSKESYYETLKTCKVVFSANKHENLGIGTFEAMSAGCIPVVPDKLSYTEMYPDRYKYICPDDLYDNPTLYVDRIANIIIDAVTSYDVYIKTLALDTTHIQSEFFSGEKMFSIINSRFKI